jgi:hypothetical protein
MGATQVYLTYAYIGAIGDGFVSETYDGERTRTLMNEVRGMTDHLVVQLRKLRSSPLSPEDQQAVDQMIGINEKLKELAQALAVYAADPQPESAEAFDKIRVGVWPQIADLLGIEEAPGAETTSPAATEAP